jgi:phosphate:Na+ symporter
VLSIAMILPFNRAMIALSERLIRPNEDETLANASLDRLDERFLAHPPLAVEQSRLTANDMLETARQNLMEALSLLANYSEESFAAVEAREERVDRYEDRIGSYLVRLNAMELTPEQSAEVSKILHTLSDFERISDHAMNLAEAAREIHDKKIRFSDAAQHELDVLLQAIYEILRVSFNAFSSNDIGLAYRVEPLEEHIDELCDVMKLHHVERLQAGVCSIDIGFVYNDLLTNLERVADHCSNVAIAVIETEENAYDAHDYVIRLREQRAHHFDAYYNEYCEKYVI